MTDVLAPRMRHGLGRIPAPDRGDRDFLMRRLRPERLAATWVYRRGPSLDQGSSSTCVGHAWRAWLSGDPIRTRRGPDPYAIYDQCVLVDEWRENDVDPSRSYGTSVRAGAKVLTSLGHVGSYLWAFSVDDVRAWLLSGKGGVVMGTNWYDAMFDPTPEGRLRVGGRNSGGHAYYLFGASDPLNGVYVQNSWGPSWGGMPHPSVRGRRAYAGCAILSYDDLDRLIREDGEACTAVEARLPRIPKVL